MKNRLFIGVVSALFYMLNPYWIFRVNSVSITVWLLSFLPLLMFFLRRALLAQNKDRLVIYSILASLTIYSMTTGLGDIPNALAAGVFVFAYMVLLAIYKRKIKALIATLTILSALVILGSFWWIGPQFFHQTIQGALSRNTSYVQESLTSIRYQVPFCNYFNVLSGIPFEVPLQRQISGSIGMIWSSGITFFSDNLSLLISLFVPIIAFLPLLSKQSKQHSEVFLFALLIIFVVPFITSLNPPSDSIIQWLMYNFPLFVFRRPSNYYFIVEFSLAYLFGFGIFFLYGEMQKLRIPKFNSISRIVVGIILVLVLVVNAFPLWLGFDNKINLATADNKIQPVNATVEVPDYVKNLCNYLNHSPAEGGVLILPRSGFLRSYNWTQGFFGLDYYPLSLNRPVLSWIGDNEPMYALYLLSERFVQENRTGFANLMELMNVKYIILAEDYLSDPARGGAYGSVFSNITLIKQYLDSQLDVTLVKTFSSGSSGGHLLYEVLKNPQTFYAVSNIYPELNLTSTYNLYDYYSQFHRTPKEPINPTVVFDGNATFWKAINEGPGSFQMVIDANSTQSADEKQSALDMKIQPGEKATVGITHTFSPHMDLSRSEYLYFEFYGSGNGEQIEVALYSGEAWDNAIKFYLNDVTEGWAPYVFSWAHPASSGGIFNISDVRTIRLNIQPSTLFTVKLGRMVVASNPTYEDIAAPMVQPWVGSDILHVDPTNLGAKITYHYTTQRRDQEFYWCRTYNSIPFNFSEYSAYRYLTLNLTTSPNVVVNAFLGLPGNEIRLYPLSTPQDSPVNFTAKNILAPLVAPNGYSFTFDIGDLQEYAQRITLSIGVINPEDLGNNTVTINELSFKHDPDITIMNFLSGWRSLVNNQIKQKNPVAMASISNASMYELNSASKFPFLETKEIEPTDYEIRVTNATTPFLLASGIKYTEDWVATTSGHKLEHIKIDGIFNGWLVNNTGDFTIQIHYLQQDSQRTFFEISEISIFITLLLLVILLIYEKKREKT
jgi:hypothetical protein